MIGRLNEAKVVLQCCNKSVHPLCAGIAVQDPDGDCTLLASSFHFIDGELHLTKKHPIQLRSNEHMCKETKSLLQTWQQNVGYFTSINKEQALYCTGTAVSAAVEFRTVTHTHTQRGGNDISYVILLSC